MTTEAARAADFSILRYAQCWEDADVLLEALRIEPGDTCLSIASAGDNALAMLTRDPARVIAVDLNPAQLAAVALRLEAYRRLGHGELLELVGSTPSARRLALYERLRPDLPSAARAFWDARHDLVREHGAGGAGKFERYFRLFRRWVLPLVHSRGAVASLLQGGDPDRREAFYAGRWDNWRWRLLFRVFFSRLVMGRLGRDPAFFRYVEGSVSDRILERTRHALTALDPRENPYLQWILAERHLTALPVALRPENFEAIRARLDRVELRLATVEEVLEEAPPRSLARFNLSDIFEYMSETNHRGILERIVRAGRPGGRLAYWNMLVPRRRPEDLAGVLRACDDEARRLHLADRAFFYSAFVVEEIAE